MPKHSQDRACVQVEGIRRNDLPAVRGPASVRLSLAVASLSAYVPCTFLRPQKTAEATYIIPVMSCVDNFGG